MERVAFISRPVIVAVIAMLTLIACTGSAGAAIHIESFGGSTATPGGTRVTQAGSHPDLVTKIEFETEVNEELGFPMSTPVELPKTIEVDLPPGLVGAPGAFPECTDAQLTGGNQGISTICPVVSQIGTIVPVGVFGPMSEEPLFNVEPPPGKPALFAANVIGNLVKITPTVRADGEYRIGTDSIDVSEGLNLSGVTVKVWGAPTDPAHDPERGGVSVANVMPPTALISTPTSCPATPLVTTMRVDSWDTPGVFDTASFDKDLSGEPIMVTGCENLPFDPKMSVAFTSLEAGRPSGLELQLEVPQTTSPDAVASAHLKRAEIMLPDGVKLNPASAGGLNACSSAQIGLGTNAPVVCPESSKIGSVHIDTPLIDSPLSGGLYLAAQGDNPFDSLVALYLVAKGPGVLLKIPGKVELEEGTGRVRVIFDDNPQFPFNSLTVRLNEGPKAPLTMPAACGAGVTTAVLTPWSGTAPVRLTSSVEVSGGGAGSCSAPRFEPEVSAGSVNPIAGDWSPVKLEVGLEDTRDPLRSIQISLPKGLLASLKGVPYCPDASLAAVPGAPGSGAAQIAAPSCPAASQVGTVAVAAGTGPSPLAVKTGMAYLAGPYKGAPLSIAVVMPAVAGPFDLGNVVVRNALEIDPVTAQVRATSDPLPTILAGIPLDLRTVRINLDRRNFNLNPTNCDAMSFGSTITSISGSTASPSAPFQVTNCERLGFAPKLSFRFMGKTNRSAHPAVTATLKTRKNDANIGRAVVTLPKTEFLENAHIRTICTRVQYAANNCPKASVYGYATAWTPLLDQPLRGPVYLRSSNNTLPDLVADLNGQIEIDLSGRIDSVNSRMRVTFGAVPDAPVSKFVLTMQGGRKGLLVNNTELCKAKPRAKAEFTGQNGKRSVSRPLVKTDCKS